MSVALLGVVGLQMYYFNQAYRLKGQLFEQTVNQALEATVAKVQKHNAYRSVKVYTLKTKLQDEAKLAQLSNRLIDLKTRYRTDEELKAQRRKKLIEGEIIFQESLISANFVSPLPISEREYKQITTDRNSPVHIQVNADVDDQYVIRGGRITSSFSTRNRKPLVYTWATLPDTLRYLVYEPGTLMPRVISLPKINAEMRARFKAEDIKDRNQYRQQLAALQADSTLSARSNRNIVSDVVNEMQQKNIPLQKRIDFGLLDTVLRAELKQHNITLPYNYAVTPAAGGQAVYQKVGYNTESPGKTNKPNTFSLPIFSNDLLRDPGMLHVTFFNVNTLLLQNMAFNLASSAALLLILVFIFAYTLYTILRQKKISEMKTDFINNMTHEFKTPVSTIMLASEALRDGDMVKDAGTVKRLAGMIYDENVRLGNHIERVLSMARLEKNELQMNEGVIDVNDLVAAVADSMALQFKKSNAQLHLNLQAGNAAIYGDELHLSNVIYNLLDNANKYSEGAPDITVSTAIVGNNAVITVADKGIGMTKDQLKRIFDQFYRVPTGNLHNVKGFGLGLNYVHDIVRRFNGTIKVTSEKNKGSVFTISFPLFNKLLKFRQ